MYKFRAISGSAWKMHSLTPPKSAKVKLSIRLNRSEVSYSHSMMAPDNLQGSEQMV